MIECCFFYGIHTNGKWRSDGGYYFNVSDTFKRTDKKVFLNWTVEEIYKMYFALKESLNKFEEFKEY